MLVDEAISNTREETFETKHEKRDFDSLVNDLEQYSRDKAAIASLAGEEGEESHPDKDRRAPRLRVQLTTMSDYDRSTEGRACELQIELGTNGSNLQILAGPDGMVSISLFDGQNMVTVDNVEGQQLDKAARALTKMSYDMDLPNAPHPSYSKAYVNQAGPCRPTLSSATLNNANASQYRPGRGR